MFTTQDQVSTLATKQTVYYYDGSSGVANSNVLFAGYCWQIIRTTDNGGVRLIYNGVALSVKSDGQMSYRYSSDDYGVCGVVTLNSSVEIDGGTGTYTDPYIVGLIVER